MRSATASAGTIAVIGADMDAILESRLALGAAEIAEPRATKII